MFIEFVAVLEEKKRKEAEEKNEALTKVSMCCFLMRLDRLGFSFQRNAEKKQALQLLEQAKREAEEANKSKTHFMAFL